MAFFEYVGWLLDQKAGDYVPVTAPSASIFMERQSRSWGQITRAGGRNIPSTFHGLRIVNGAQTSAILGDALRAAQERGPAALARLAEAEVPIRFLKLSSRPPGFGAQAAFTHNRINPVTPRDALAMQYVQQRLRDDFTLSWGRRTWPGQTSGPRRRDVVLGFGGGSLDGVRPPRRSSAHRGEG